MEALYLIRLVLGCFFIGLGVLLFALEILGVFRLKYILDRMHFAGSGDTFAFACVIIGAIIINGINFTSAKLLLVLVFFWFASPVSSHLISRMVTSTDEDLEEHVKTLDEEESKSLIEQ